MDRLIVGGEKKLSELTARVFGELKANEARRAEAALLAANPHLSDLRNLKAGIAVLVPKVPGVAAPDLKDRGETLPGPKKSLGGTFDSYRKGLLERMREERSRVAAEAKLLDELDVAELIREEPEAEAVFRRVREGLEARAKALEAREPKKAPRTPKAVGVKRGPA
jgi:hypothetical protein